MDVKASKVAIVGAGSVGATLAYNLALKGAVTEIALIDSNKDKAEAEVLDIKQGASLGRSVGQERLRVETLTASPGRFQNVSFDFAQAKSSVWLGWSARAAARWRKASSGWTRE